MKLQLIISVLIILGVACPCAAWWRKIPAMPGILHCDCEQCWCYSGFRRQNSSPTPKNSSPTPKNSSATQNGCADFMPRLTETNPYGFKTCCDAHDICYGTCGVHRAICDHEFHKCTSAICNVSRLTEADGGLSCLRASLSFTTYALHERCPAFTSAQRQRCSCTEA